LNIECENPAISGILVQTVLIVVHGDFCDWCAECVLLAARRRGTVAVAVEVVCR